MPNVSMKHESDPRDVLLKQVGDISEFKICNNEVLIAIYRRPEKTVGGIVIPKSNLDEDLFQSKAGLVLAIGPSCDFPLVPIALHDWILVRPADTYALEVNKVSCRLVYDKYIRVKIPHPEMIW
jgi:hypothetical protein